MQSYNDTFEQLPFDLEAEQSVLGALLIDSSCIATVLEYLTVDCFHKEQHKKMFSILLTMFSGGETMDFITILDKVRGEKVFESDEQAKLYLTQLVQIVPTSKNVDEYAKIVREKYYLRRLINVSADIRSKASEGMEAKKLLDRAEQQIYEIRQGRDSTGLVHISDVLVKTYDNLQVVAKESKDGLLGLSWGFSDFDRATNGLNKSDLIILAARPAVGKTSLALNIASFVGERSGKSVAIFSLEMSKEQLVLRMLSSLAKVPNNQLRTGQLEDSQWADVAEASGILSSSQIYIDDTSSITIGDMRAKLRRINNLGLVVVDYLQLMTSEKYSDNRVQAVSEITRNLKILARDLNVPVIVLSQLSRASEKSPEPNLSDLRDSGSIEQDADIVLFLYREAYYDSEKADDAERSDPNKAVCMVAKNRHGAIEDVPLYWDGAHTRFTSQDVYH